jgi:uncharacterized LabA/DUF88 family protein
VPVDTEVAVFIDLENLRYSLLNKHSVEPDLDHIVAKAKNYGRPSVMRAYADFAEHPSELMRSLAVVGVEAINVPVKRTTHRAGTRDVERVKNAADMHLALDAVIQAVEADASGKRKVFLLVAGDGDYVKLVTLLRNRFGQRVVVAGVPGSISGDLTRAADDVDPVAVPVPAPVDRTDLQRRIVAMVRRGPSPLRYWTFRTIDQWTQDARQGMPGTANDRRDAIRALLETGVLVQRTGTDPVNGEVTMAVLDEDAARRLGFLEPVAGG